VVGPRLSPDGRKLAVTIIDSGFLHSDVWVYDLSREVRTRFTFESTKRARMPVWSPDGSQIAFSADRQGSVNIYVKSTSGAGGDVTLLEEASVKSPGSWSPDGRTLAYIRNDSNAGFVQSQIWILPLFGDRKPFPFLPSSFTEESPEFSPDGRWMAYQSNESGNFQIYVAAFPGAQTKVQVSSSGGFTPAWRADGKELFYLDMNSQMMAVEVKAIGGRLELGTPRPLFQTHGAYLGIRPYDVSRGADRFVVTTTGDVNPSPFTLVVNWIAELNKK